MTFLGVLKRIVIGAPLGVLAVTALPVFGAVGSITAVGVAVGSAVGAVAGIADEINSG